MKCLHCAVEIHDYFEENAQHIWVYSDSDRTIDETDEGWWVSFTDCPACDKPMIKMWRVEKTAAKPTGPHETNSSVPSKSRRTESFIAYPRFALRLVPSEITDPLRSEFLEACAVLPASPKASAALSRRCLQLLLREQGFTANNLAPQIDQLINANILPSHLRDAVDAIRNIGNFAAHPLKSTATGEIVDVEPGEAEWTLDVLEDLFDFFIVRPKQTAAKKAALNAKLLALGKPAMK